MIGLIIETGEKMVKTENTINLAGWYSVWITRWVITPWLSINPFKWAERTQVPTPWLIYWSPWALSEHHGCHCAMQNVLSCVVSRLRSKVIMIRTFIGKTQEGRAIYRNSGKMIIDADLTDERKTLLKSCILAAGDRYHSQSNVDQIRGSLA